MNVRKTFGINKAITGPSTSGGSGGVQAGINYIRQQPKEAPSNAKNVASQVANLSTNQEVVPTFNPGTDTDFEVDDFNSGYQDKMVNAIEVFKAITGGSSSGSSGGDGGGKIEFEGGSKTLTSQAMINPSKSPKILPALLEYDIGPQSNLTVSRNKV